MNTTGLLRRTRDLAFVLFALLATVSNNVHGGLAAPTIINVYLNGADIFVRVNVPGTVAKVTLESRSRFGQGTWTPRAVSRQTGELTFKLRASADTEMLRVRADQTDVLPAFFYRGSNQFNGALSSTPYYGDKGNGIYYGDNTVPSSEPADSGNRSVVESDIWKIDGETLYYFNQLRGLQIIDLHNPQAPVLRGSLYLPAVGEQMYLVNSNTVALLARTGYQTIGGSGPESQVLIVGVTNGQPTIRTNLPVWGWISESRLVGTALYVASSTYLARTNATEVTWEYGTQVTSFDLSNPQAPGTKGTLWYTGYNNVVTATPKYLFVVAQNQNNWYQSFVNCIDISSPDGVMRSLATIPATGAVYDKFKLNVGTDPLGKEFLTIISARWDGGRWLTMLETFSLIDPKNPVRLATWNLEQARGEQLHATRFDGNRVYLVTFFRIDPLWVIDLSNPSQPRIAGSIEVPGWSNYIEPLGNRLVTVGIDNTNGWRVSVSLFDVADSARPALVSRLPLGEDDTYSWSEANSNEKAVSVLPQAGLILVPYQGYSTNGYASRVQLIDLNLDDLTTNALRLRGIIEHQAQPRRATLLDNTILSISGRELLSVNANDRDHPQVNAVLELAWPVNQVFLKGNYLIEIESGSMGWWWLSSEGRSVVRVAAANDPDKVLSRLVLTNLLPASGAVLHEDHLYLAQSQYGWNYAVPLSADAPNTNPPTFCFSVIDVSHLPQLQLVGQWETNLVSPMGTSIQAHWPKPGVLVWSGGGYSYGPWYLMDASPGAQSTAIYGMPWRGYWGGGSGHFLAFDVANPQHPDFLSEVNLTTNSWWNFSAAINVQELLYSSHTANEFVEVTPAPGSILPKVGTIDSSYYTTNGDAVGYWTQKYYLDVLDYTDPRHPVTRAPVNLPGLLKGVAVNGSVLFTVGYHWTATGTSDYREWLDALAYDGVSAALVDSMLLPSTWPHPVLTLQTNILIGNADNSTGNMNCLETWQLSGTGRLVRLNVQQLNAAVNAFALLDSLLVLQQNYYGYLLFDATDILKLKRIGSGQVSGYLWGSLDSADGAIDRGLWLPLADYGVAIIPLDQNQ
jgi:hypothetical protein